MQFTILGRTGLKVSVAGLGCGGSSRIGMRKYGSDHAAGIVRAAYDLEVNFFDTAHVYGTEPAVGKGLEGIKRDTYILSSKFPSANVNKPSDDFEKILDQSLTSLKTDYIDIYHFHGVMPENYAPVREKLISKMIKAKKDGKIRFIGITENFGSDTTHEMIKQAFKDDFWDVIMLGHNIINPSAVKRVLPYTMKKNIGTLDMFAVRSALSNPEQLIIDVAKILEAGQADPKLLPKEHTLDFLTRNGVAASIMEAAYRFCRHTKGIDVVLTGTSSKEHLKQNIEAIQKPKLPDEVLEKLDAMFGNVDVVSGQ